jgi:hypothetical protein
MGLPSCFRWQEYTGRGGVVQELCSKSMKKGNLLVLVSWLQR